MVLDTFVYTEAEPLRADWLSIASHEFRTPLTVLKLQTQHLHRRLARQGLDEDVAILAQIEGQLQKLERLQGDLLNVSTMQTGRLAYVAWRVALKQVLRRAVGRMDPVPPAHA